MNKITVKLLEPTIDIDTIAQLACLTTRAANKYSTANELTNYIQDNSWDHDKVNSILKLPHNKIKRFMRFAFIVSGASRRFLAQLNTHQMGINIDYMSGSLQYSNHYKQSLDDKFTIPYDIINNTTAKEEFLASANNSYNAYCNLVKSGVSNDAAGYLMPECIRNVILINVNLEELCYIGSQRLCKRNTSEISYVVAKMIELVCNQYHLDFKMFLPKCCNEGVYSCGKPITANSPKEYLLSTFPDLEDSV